MYVVTKIQVGTQTGDEGNGIIQLQVANAPQDRTLVFTHLKQADRIGWPKGCGRGACGVFIDIGEEAAKAGAADSYGLCWVKGDRTANSAFVGKSVIGAGQLDVQIYFQTVFEKPGTKIQAGRLPPEITRTKDAVLV